MIKTFFFIGLASVLVGCVHGGGVGGARDYQYKKNQALEELLSEVDSGVVKSSSEDGFIPQYISEEVWGIPVRGKFIYDMYKSKRLERLRYESDAEYSARVGVVDDIYTISSYMTADYNPETKSISIPRSLGEYYLTKFGSYYREEGGFRKYYGVSAGYGESSDLGYYQGSNAFGVSTQVSKSKGSEYYVILGSSEDLLYEPTLELVGNCSASSSDMRQAEGGIYVEFMVRPVSPYTYSASKYETPTLSNPVERQTDYGFVRANPLAARVKLNKVDKILDGCGVRIFDARAERLRYIKSVEAGLGT